MKNKKSMMTKQEINQCKQDMWEICSFCKKRSTVEEKSFSLLQLQYQGEDFFTCDKCRKEGEGSIKNFPEVAKYIYFQTINSNKKLAEKLDEITKGYIKEYEKAANQIEKLKIIVNRIMIANKEIKLEADTLKKIVIEKELEIEKYGKEREFTINSIVEISFFASMLEMANRKLDKYEYVKMDGLDDENKKELIKKIEQISKILLSSLENRSIENQMEQMVIQGPQTPSSSTSYIYME
jgi:hypothetical protein